MSFRIKANALFVSALLIGQAWAAPSQSDLPESTTVVGCLSERAGKLMLPGKDGDNYILVGHAAGLSAHVGDELSVSGRIRDTESECIGEHCEYALSVKSFRTIVKKNPAGVQPRLDDPRNWSTFRERDFGVVVRHPKTFPQKDVEPCCTQSDLVNPTGILTLQTWDVPKEVYRSSNFEGGTFEISVDPTIRSEGTCRQFGSTEPGDTFLRTLGGIRYAQTQIGSVGMGTGYMEYHLRTFQNGFCYEFKFEFVELDGTGIDKPCLIQWLSRKNEQQLLDALLSRVSFVAPGRVAGKPRTQTNPLPDS